MLLLLAMLVMVGLMLGQFDYQGRQLLSLRREIKSLNESQMQELETLGQIQKNGVAMRGTSTTQTGGSEHATSGDIRETLANGDRYVCYPNLPLSTHNPFSRPNYAPGDWLVLNLGSEPRTLAPYIPRDAGAYAVQGSVLESLLVRSSVTLKWEPWLARSYLISKNGLKITVILRTRARFSDGSPVTAKDVVFSYDTMMNPKINCAPYRSTYTDFASCTSLNKHTVVFKLKKPYFKALEDVGQLSIIPEHVYHFKKASDFNNKDGRKLIGSGPYMLDKWTPGQELVLVRNPRYWGHRPTFNRIVYRFIQSPQAALQSFLTGEIDTDSPRAAQYVRFTHKPGFTKKYICYQFHTPSDGYEYISWNIRSAMFHDRRTRTALAMLVNRAAIIKTILHGLAVEINGPFNVFSPQNDQSIQPIHYDPAGARALLAKAGWKKNADGILQRKGKLFKFNLLTPAHATTITAVSVYIQRQFAKAGIRMAIEPCEFSILVRRLDLRQFHAYFLGWTGSMEQDPYQIWDSRSIADEGSNAGAFSNSQADKLISEGRREMNLHKRLAIWHKLQAIIYRQQPYLFLFQSYDMEFINHRFHNTKPYGYFGTNTGNWYVPFARQKYH